MDRVASILTAPWAHAPVRSVILTVVLGFWVSVLSRAPITLPSRLVIVTTVTQAHGVTIPSAIPRPLRRPRPVPRLRLPLPVFAWHFHPIASLHSPLVNPLRVVYGALARGNVYATLWTL